MTDFEKIKAELERLGWKPSHGRGDHVKFSKEGKHDITISRQISDQGRSFKNAIADIRRDEPEFSIGRQEHHLKKNKTKQDSPPQELPEPLPGTAHVTVGARVRYTKPENRDFTLLTNPDALMNVEHTVIRILDPDRQEVPCITKGTPENHMAELSSDHGTFQVPATDIDAWELFTCSKCGRTLPANLKTTNGRQTVTSICPECRQVISDSEKEIRKLNTSFAELIKLLPPDNRNTDNGNQSHGLFQAFLPFLTEQEKTLFDPYRNSTLEEIPMDTMRNIITVLSDIMTRTAASIAKQRTTAPPATKPAPQKTARLFSIWKEFIFSISDSINNSFTEKKWTKPNRIIRQQRVRCTYSTEKLQTGSIEIRITCPDPTTAFIIAQCSTLLYILLDKLSENYIARLVCRDADFDKYLTDDNEHNQKLKSLLSISDDNLTGRFSLFHTDTQIRNLCKIEEEFKLIANLRSKENQPVTVQEQYGVTFGLTYYNDTENTDRFGLLSDLTESEQQYRIYITTENEPDSETRDNLHKILEILKRNTGIYNIQCLLLSNTKDKNPIPLSYIRNISDDNFLEPRQRFTPKHKYVVLDMLESNPQLKAFEEHCSSINRDPTYELLELMHRAVNGTSPETHNNPTEKQETTQTENINMNTQTSPLDSINEASEDSDLGQKTTRELLRELKARGVLFTDLTVPVITRQSVSLDEL